MALGLESEDSALAAFQGTSRPLLPLPCPCDVGAVEVTADNADALAALGIAWEAPESAQDIELSALRIDEYFRLLATSDNDGVVSPAEFALAARTSATDTDSVNELDTSFAA